MAVLLIGFPGCGGQGVSAGAEEIFLFFIFAVLEKNGFLRYIPYFRIVNIS